MKRKLTFHRCHAHFSYNLKTQRTVTSGKERNQQLVNYPACSNKRPCCMTMTYHTIPYHTIQIHRKRTKINKESQISLLIRITHHFHLAISFFINQCSIFHTHFVVSLRLETVSRMFNGASKLTSKMDAGVTSLLQ